MYSILNTFCVRICRVFWILHSYFAAIVKGILTFFFFSLTKSLAWKQCAMWSKWGSKFYCSTFWSNSKCLFDLNFLVLMLVCWCSFCFFVIFSIFCGFIAACMQSGVCWCLLCHIIFTFSVGFFFFFRKQDGMNDCFVIHYFWKHVINFYKTTAYRIYSNQVGPIQKTIN